MGRQFASFCILFGFLSLGGCAAGPRAKTFIGPTGEKGSSIRCTKETSSCFIKASEVCEGKSYRVIDSYRNSGGLLADTLPGPVTWYTMSIVCGPSNGIMPQFPLRGSEPEMPDFSPGTRTECVQNGNRVNCTSN